MSNRFKRLIAALASALVLPMTVGSVASADQVAGPVLAQENQQQQVDTDSDWEWIGLFGLLGLLGLIPRRRRHEVRNAEGVRHGGQP
ncbi:hypothetical protein GCM10027445_33750 [Amycolatopsis endophytica]|uniref:MYXO-CTERM domain-containing protein n=1 Tax=Amycolatopsis endophytica TaxID=860233 RepID=A0A853B085_9PSEU|nr:WGxxGxxG family protein [Amycolatopsis endophytica]NYI88438.1 MYXO-CTERM domain-containing protein [Amycolatopsis endophytica]